MHVAVLMSTYNGEKYLREQMDSLLNQTGVMLEIFVRDDGSTDGTIDILKDYSERNTNVRLDIGNNVGVGNSFMQLVYSVPNNFDYYAFSDQDDIWLDNKLSKAIEMIGENEGSILYCSNQILIDSSGKEIGIRYDKTPNLLLEKILVHNKATGCTMVWNSALQKILGLHLPSEQLLKNRIHDVWVAMVASVCGNIIYDENSYILYRQHENNVVGAKESTTLSVLREKVKKFKNKNLRNGRSLMAKEMVRLFPVETSSKHILSIAADAKTFEGKKMIIKHYKDFISCSGEKKIDFIFKVVFDLF